MCARRTELPKCHGWVPVSRVRRLLGGPFLLRGPHLVLNISPRNISWPERVRGGPRGTRRHAHACLPLRGMHTHTRFYLGPVLRGLERSTLEVQFHPEGHTQKLGSALHGVRGGPSPHLSAIAERERRVAALDARASHLSVSSLPSENARLPENSEIRISGF